MRSLLPATLLLAVCSTSGLLVVSPALDLTLSPANRPCRLASAPVMKGKGSRGVPGNRGSFNAGGGMTKKGKAGFEKADFQKSEWTLVAEKGDLGAATGSTKSVEAGQTPQGQAYIWTLVRGVPLSEEEDAPETTVYATDGSCRTCLFPLSKGTTSKEGDGYALTCELCGTRHSLDTGEVLEFCPKKNPVQMAAAMLNEKKGPVAGTVLRTRVSKANRIYVRLPDGTLPITTQRVEGTINTREEIAPQPSTAKKSTSKKARLAAKAGGAASTK